jgi:hypothetical protein
LSVAVDVVRVDDPVAVPAEAGGAGA